MKRRRPHICLSKSNKAKTAKAPRLRLSKTKVINKLFAFGMAGMMAQGWQAVPAVPGKPLYAGEE